MEVTMREAERIFAKLEITTVKSTHHVRGFVTLNGKRVLPVHYSFGRKPMPPSVSRMFRVSLRMTEDELRAFIRCTFSREEYLASLESRLLAVSSEQAAQ